MTKENKNLLWAIPLFIVLSFLLDGLLLYLGIDISGFIASSLESVFG